MSSMLSSHGVVLATTAMLVSSTVLYLTLSWQKPEFHSSSEGKRKLKKKKKRVHFADNVKLEDGNGELYRKEQMKKLTKVDQFINSNNNCRSHEIPANRVALYNGILRDRVHRIECSF
ncbi:hypothetical protein ACFE04_032014 [Oxalis oulophora]